MGVETGASMGATGEHNGWPSEKGGRPGTAGTVAAAVAVAVAAALAWVNGLYEQACLDIHRPA